MWKVKATVQIPVMTSESAMLEPAKILHRTLHLPGLWWRT